MRIVLALAAAALIAWLVWPTAAPTGVDTGDRTTSDSPNAPTLQGTLRKEAQTQDATERPEGGWLTQMDGPALNVTGVVLNATGTPVAGATVQAFVARPRLPHTNRGMALTDSNERQDPWWMGDPSSLKLATRRTGSDGRFAFSIDRHTRTTIRATHSTLGSTARLLRPSARGLTRDVELHLKRDYRGAIRVIQSDGHPCIGCECRLRGSLELGVLSTRTDSTGLAVWEHLPSNEYEGYAIDHLGIAACFHFRVPDENSEPTQIQLSPGVDQPFFVEGLDPEALKQGAVLGISVLDSKQFTNYGTAIIDATGRASLKGIPPGDILALNIATPSQTSLHLEWGDVSISSPVISDPPKEIRCRVPSLGGLKGRALLGGQPLTMATASLLRQTRCISPGEWNKIVHQPRTVRIRVDGTFHFDSIAPGTYAVVVEGYLPGGCIGQIPKSLESRGPTCGALIRPNVVTDCGDIECDSGGRIEGSIVPCPWPNAVCKIRVEDSDESFTAETRPDREGAFHFPIVPSGRPLRVFTYDSDVDIESTVTVPSGATTRVELSADPPAWIEGFVRNDKGQGVADAHVVGWSKPDRCDRTFFGQSNGEGGGLSAKDGSFRVPYWPEIEMKSQELEERETSNQARWGISVNHPEYEYNDEGAARVTEHQSSTTLCIDITLRPRRKWVKLFSGRVVDAQGDPVDHAEVLYALDGITNAPIHTTISGEFEIEGPSGASVTVKRIHHLHGIWDADDGQRDHVYSLTPRVTLKGWFVDPRNGEKLSANVKVLIASKMGPLPTAKRSARYYPEHHPRLALSLAWDQFLKDHKKYIVSSGSYTCVGFDAEDLPQDSYMLIFVPSESDKGDFLPTVAGPFKRSDVSLVVDAKVGKELRGRVVDGSGIAVPDAVVVAAYPADNDSDKLPSDDPRPNTITNSKGCFNLGGLTEANVGLIVYKDGYRAVLVEAEDVTDNSRIELSRGHTIRGVLFDEDEEPVRGCRLDFEPQGANYASFKKRLRTLGGGPWLHVARRFGASAWTDSKGMFELTGLPDLPTRITVDNNASHRFRDRLVLPLKAIRPASEPVTLHMHPARTALGRLVLPPSNGAESEEWVTLIIKAFVDSSEDSPYKSSNSANLRSEPSFAFFDLPPGPFEIRIWHKDATDDEPLVRVNAQAGDQNIVINVPTLGK